MLRIFLLFFSVIASDAVIAHSAERPREPVARHGGIAINADDYNLELVLTEEMVTLYVYSHGNRPLHTASSTAEVLFKNEQGEFLVTLTAEGGNRLSHKRPNQMDSPESAIVDLRMFSKAPVQAIFRAMDT